MLKTLRNKKGVTLVELLAVIVILGIIAAIAVPTIGGLIDRQRLNAAEAEFDNAVEAARLYFSDESATTVTADTLFNENYLSADPFKAGVLFTISGNVITAAPDGGATIIEIGDYTIDGTTGEATLTTP